MFKDVLRHADLAQWAEMGLVIFFLTFVGAVVWAMTRRRADVEQWAALPLEGEVLQPKRQRPVKENGHE